MFSILKKQIQLVIIIITIILTIAILIWAYFRFAPTSNLSQDRLVINIDKTAILEQVRQLEVLNTVEQTLQRDFEVRLESQDLEFFGVKILESNRSQKFAVTGSVNAGIDLSQLQLEDVVFNQENNTIQITTPAPKVTAINLLEDKIYLINDRSSFLFNVQNLNPETSRDRTQQLQQELIRTGNTALLDAACNNQILETANLNAQESLKNLFLLVQADFEIEIITTPADNCEFNQ